MIDAETTRASYRPNYITTLFVGESAPANGDFFYYGKNAMLRHMQRATEAVLGEGGDFLERFKGYGWYLDDLVLTPVDRLTPAERKAKCLAAGGSLRDRIAAYRPLAVVPVLISIKSIVEAAVAGAGSNAKIFCVPFPGMGQQTRFHNEMLKIIPQLPRNGIENVG
ncbi:hypothetical protein IVB02_14455 [Bradyrhizobium sp. 166]|uniref:hypothetical protein n=1 Tax=Bradyrhizobium sp. 166 TaxID=2782638 RepID=UPI001FFBB51A|nr:hypothetical protein [Bradyrhizobium sp. 166]MCK1602614.1 hypothetical protein [Bradyrhizobium sp. 166]